MICSENTNFVSLKDIEGKKERVGIVHIEEYADY